MSWVTSRLGPRLRGSEVPVVLAVIDVDDVHAINQSRVMDIEPMTALLTELRLIAEAGIGSAPGAYGQNTTDEYALLVHADDEPTLRQTLGELEHCAGSAGCTLSIGLARGAGESVIHRAARAMYEAKRAGKNRTVDADDLASPAKS